MRSSDLTAARDARFRRARVGDIARWECASWTTSRVSIHSRLVATRRARKAARKQSQSKSQPGELGPLLADLRVAKGLSLRQVEDAARGAVSNAYLSQLENGRIRKPSPNVLHSLAEVYGVPYEALMDRAGYLLPSTGSGGRRNRLAVFSIDDLTAEEEEELLKYLAFLRSRS